MSKFVSPSMCGADVICNFSYVPYRNNYLTFLQQCRWLCTVRIMRSSEFYHTCKATFHHTFPYQWTGPIN
ncbi:hypothetical protein PR048_005512 [Dryococelus australis]|uniref:Uncharacterized protein n=1 Tax=Dryococelus australis TaxID=614101 RepID=A0ABQ9I8G5_9NEOP|nr:hypothetical protein PR048_005512 [Dryococelus australis]